MSKRALVIAAAAGAMAAEAGLIHLGRTHGSTRDERTQSLPGDDIIPVPGAQTDHATTIDVPPSEVWPWLVQMGWGGAGWYTARRVDRPRSGPSSCGPTATSP